ncbi:MAG TPA: prepilin-type N-terminal cleavage/methylation domain-containing protein [Vicinamibacterales bacterium]|nr:prepilin-type N-terminal cleavage/methylation domain-containing protein [Vicinamibacterales bacterium]
MAARLRSEAGFTLVELLIATALLLTISGIVTSALMQMSKHQQTIWNRTEMHSGVRGATELLQQEVGQAGRVTLPGPVTLTVPIVTPAGTFCTPGVPVTATVNSTTGMFVGEWLTTLDGDAAETVQVVSIPSATTFTACFTRSHPDPLNPNPVTTVSFRALGGFATGIIAPSFPGGSTANRLKMYGDINGDGTMVYIEYYCDNGDLGTDGSFNLYRNVVQPFVPFGAPAAVKPPVDSSMVLLSNVHPNPPDAGGVARPCFLYQEPVPPSVPGMVLDVAVTLTVWSQGLDPITKQIQTETKALLNVSPRNVFFTWEFAGLGYMNRVQPTPPAIAALLP